MTIKDRDTIQATIDKFGVCLVAVSDAAHCEACGPDTTCRSHAAATYTEMDDGFVYTIGHQARNRPDLVILCGPTPVEETPMPRDELVTHLEAAADLLNHLVSNWDDHPVLPGQRCADASGRRYMVDASPEGVAYAKQALALGTVDFYGSDRFGMLVLVPMPAPKPASPTLH